MNEYLDRLTGIPLFAGIAREDLGGMLDCLGSRVKSYRKDEFIWMEGHRNPPMGLVMKGELNIIREDIAGNRTIIARIGPLELFGETFVCAQVSESPVTVQAVTPCSVLFLGFENLIHRCSNACLFHSRLIQNMMLILARKNIALTQKINILVKNTTRGKIAAYLLEAASGQRRSDISIPYSRTELADYLGVNRSALSRELGKMRDEGLFSFRRSEFRIHDTARLSEISSGSLP